MKTVKIMVPVEGVLPVEYAIKVKFNGNRSRLVVRERYDPETPPQVMETTIAFLEMIAGQRRGIKVKRVSEFELKLAVTGPEEAIAAGLLSEMDLLRTAYLEPPPPPAIMPPSPKVPGIG